jgi:cytochrome c oxidase subunit 2
VVTGDINAQTDLIINGKAAMPAFGKSLNAAELAQVITYTRNALGNKMGDDIQPKTIKGLLGGEASAPAKTEPAPAKTEEKVVDLSKDELVAQGKEVYAKNCSSCHQENGAGTPPIFPALTASAVVKGDINAQAKLVLGGKGMMPAFNSLSSTEVAAVITYTRNALGNSVGDVLQASAVKSLQAAK